MSGGLSLGCQQGGVRTLFRVADSWLCPQMVEGVRELFGASLIRTLIPFMRAPPSWPSHLPKASPLKTITLGTRISTCEFFCGGHRHSDYSSWTLKFVASLSITLLLFSFLIVDYFKSLYWSCYNILFHVLVFWPWGMWDLGSPTRDWTCNPCTGRRSLNHWTVREVPLLFPSLTCFLRPYIPVKPTASTSLPCLL